MTASLILGDIAKPTNLIQKFETEIFALGVS